MPKSFPYIVRTKLGQPFVNQIQQFLRIEAVQNALNDAIPVRVRVVSNQGAIGGFEGDIHVETENNLHVIVDGAQVTAFRSSVDDPNGFFPARIRAAAKALILEGRFGCFQISHCNSHDPVLRTDDDTGVVISWQILREPPQDGVFNFPMNAQGSIPGWVQISPGC